jgi:glycosyltransferase involved in cell wall biosynthesis
MKILHVGPIRPVPGAAGPSQSIPSLAVAQADIGLNVGLLPSLPLEPEMKVVELPSVCLVEGPRKRHYNPWYISRDWIVRIREEFGTPDIVNFHSVYDPFQTALARRCRQLSWPYIITPRGGMTYLAQEVKHLKKTIGNVTFFRRFVKHAAAIHALLPKEAEQIQALFKVKKIIIVPNGVEDYLLQVSKKLSAADLGDFGRECDLMLGFVGRIYVYYKGFDLLLKAMAILRSQPDRIRCKLFVIGPFHSRQDGRSFCLTVESLGLKDDVKLLGPKYGEEKLRYFLACDVFVHTSRSEGMPMSVLEAMALGCPCLVTPGTNMADVVREGGGWECEPNPDSIAETIKLIYEKRDSLKVLGQQSRELIKSQFTWHKVAQQLSEEYAKVISQDKS